MRQMVTQVMREDKATAKETHENTSASTGADHKQYSSSSNQAKDEDKASGKSYPETVSVTAEAKSVSTSSGGSAKQSKPAWAFASEKEVENLLEEKEQSEVDELINFAQSLDFDKYIGDMEVQTMMERLKKRITDLEKDVAMEESREAESDERRAKREMLEALV